MEDRALALRRLLPAVFLSGAAGLLYESLWVRVLSVRMGSGTAAVCTVLSIYMAGMAAGSWWFGRRADRGRDGRALYAGLEAAVGVFCALSPLLFRWVPGAWAALVIVPPTVLLGGTLPALVSASGAGPALARDVSRLYFWNTLGGALGALAGALLIPRLGVAGLTVAAAAGSLGAAAWARALGPETAASAAAEAPAQDGASPERPAEADPAPAALWAAFALCGLAGLGHEFIWTRLVALVLGPSVYSFSLMLAAFLLGLALGGRLAVSFLARVGRPAAALGWIQLGVGASSLAALALYPQLSTAYVALYDLLGRHSGLFTLAQFALALAPLLVPTTLMGMVFPVFTAALGRRARAGAGVGAAYAANTLGAALGPWAVAFVAVPLFGLSGAAFALAALNFVLGLACFALDSGTPSRRVLAAAAVAAAAWALTPGIDPAVLHSGAAIYTDVILKAGLPAVDWRRASGDELLVNRDGVEASVSVWRQRNGARYLVINGKVDASESGDVATQTLLGHLPAGLSAAARKPGARVLVIGLGSGMTVAALARHPFAVIDVVEIEAGVAAVSPYFERINRGVLADPRVSVHIGDARGFLARRGAPYDVIVSEPSNPWISGVAHLFTSEFYALARARLAPGGLLCQWLQLYGMTPEALRTGAETVRQAFPHVQAWRASTDLLLVSSERPLAADWGTAERLLAVPGVAEDLERMRITAPSDLLARRYMAESGLARFAASGPRGVHTDDRPSLEFAAPEALRDRGAAARNIGLIEDFSEPLTPEALGAPDRTRWLARSLLIARRPAAAERVIAGLPAADPWRAGLLRDLAEAYLRSQRPQDMARLYAARLAEAPRDPDALLDAARGWLEAGEREKALGALERYARRVPRGGHFPAALARAGASDGPAEAFQAVALAYAEAGRGTEAADVFGRVAALKPALFDSGAAGEAEGYAVQ